MSSLLAVSLLLGAAAARVESIQLSDTGSRASVRVVWTGTPALVSVHREGNVARVTLTDAELGLAFAGGTRFAFASATAPTPASQAPFQGLDVESRKGEIVFNFRVAPETPIDVQRGANNMVVSFRAAGLPKGTLLAGRTAPSVIPMAAIRAMTPPPAPPAHTAPPPMVALVPARPPAAAPEPAPAPAPPTTTPPAPEPVVTARVEPQTPPPSVPAAPTGLTTEVTTTAPGATTDKASTQTPPAPASDIHQRLFPIPSETGAEPLETGAPASDLYTKLFPYTAEATAAPAAAPEAVTPTAPEEETAPGLRMGPFNVRPGVRAGFVDAEANFLANPEPVRDQYLEIQPKLAVDAAVGSGRFSLTYEPILRALGSYEATQSSTHPVEATLDAPLGTRGRIKISDTFVSGLLETTQVDPGGEYFFDLGRFNKNAAGVNASIDVGPRFSVELGGGYDWVDFSEPSAFFGYRRAMGSVGLGFEATPNLKTTFSYIYDTVPDVDERPEATYDAHNVQVGLLGDILPLLRGSLYVGYRDQKSPNAAPGGDHFQGVTAGASLTRDLGREAAVTVLFNRSTPLSNYQGNAFYVTTAVSASFLAPLPWEIALNAGGGYHWNDYKTLVTGTDFPREDRIIGWFVGLRRPLDRRVSAFAGYRWERRTSNIEPFENDTHGLLIQLDVDIFGRTR